MNITKNYEFLFIDNLKISKSTDYFLLIRACKQRDDVEEIPNLK